MGGQSQLPLNLSGLIVAALLILAALLNRPPLESERPLGARVEAEPAGPFEQIPARLWQDPFEAVARPAARAAPPQGWAAAGQADTPAASGTTPAGPASDAPPVVTRYLEYLSGTNATTRLLLLPVMVPGTGNPVDREQRLRVRSAVHAGLAAGGFRPLSGNRIGGWTWTSPAGPITLPFEALIQDRGGWCSCSG